MELRWQIFIFDVFFFFFLILFPLNKASEANLVDQAESDRSGPGISECSFLLLPSSRFRLEARRLSPWKGPPLRQGGQGGPAQPPFGVPACCQNGVKESHVSQTSTPAGYEHLVPPLPTPPCIHAVLRWRWKGWEALGIGIPGCACRKGCM